MMWKVLLVLAALPVVLLLLGFVGVVLLLLPPHVSAVSLAVLAVIGLWFVVSRRTGSGPVSELSLIGSQSSKDGLL